MFKTSSILKGLKKPFPSSLAIELIRAHEVGNIKLFKSLWGHWEFCRHFDCGDNSHIHWHKLNNYAFCKCRRAGYIWHRSRPWKTGVWLESRKMPQNLYRFAWGSFIMAHDDYGSYIMMTTILWWHIAISRALSMVYVSWQLIPWVGNHMGVDEREYRYQWVKVLQRILSIFLSLLENYW